MIIVITIIVMVLINDNRPGNEPGALSTISGTSPVPIHAAAKAGQQHEDLDDGDHEDDNVDDDDDEYYCDDA